MISVAEVLKNIQSEKFSPVYMLTGKEKFFHDQIIKNFSEALFADPSSRSLNRIVLHGSENSLPDVVNASLSFPMLSNYKLVIVKEFSKIKTADQDSFIKYLENTTRTTILLLSSEDLGKTKLFTDLKKMAVTVDCKPVPDYKLPALIKERLNQKKMTMSAQAVTILAEYTGNNLLNIEHELQKIKDFKAEDSEISVDEVIAVTGMSKEYNVFTLQKALINKNLKRSFVIGKKLIEKGENINLIISILFNYFKKAFLVAKLKGGDKDALSISRELKINEYQQRDISATLKIFDTQKLEKVINTFSLLDKRVKSTDSSDWAVLQSLCYSICRE